MGNIVDKCNWSSRFGGRNIVVVKYNWPSKSGVGNIVVKCSWHSRSGVRNACCEVTAVAGADLAKSHVRKGFPEQFGPGTVFPGLLPAGSYGSRIEDYLSSLILSLPTP